MKGPRKVPIKLKSIVVLGAMATALLVPMASFAADPVLIYIEDGYGTEGNVGDLPTFVEFKASLSAPSTLPVSFSYSTPANHCVSVNDTCAYPVFDYVDSAGTVVFAPGETTKSFLVPIVPDSYSEPTEGFPVELWAPVNGAFPPGYGLGDLATGWTDWLLCTWQGVCVDRSLWGTVTEAANGLSRGVWGYIGDDDRANVAPTANFSYTCSGRDCAFTDSSTDSDGTIKGWAWSFGDLATSSAQNPSHTYAADGTYTVTLQVTDNNGATAAASKTLTIDATPPTQPTGLTAQALKGRKIKLSWNASTDNGSGLASYRIERSSSGSAFAVIATATTTSYTDSGLTKGKTYTYRVVACDKLGNCSQPSNTASATAT